MNARHQGRVITIKRVNHPGTYGVWQSTTVRVDRQIVSVPDADRLADEDLLDAVRGMLDRREIR
ncbi:hypothetical protein [Deinococcus apachensis]|uniref:hypothetical protein n=1 Tax=Deinococcus apachensis TaxID=309886 RepID=UPI000373CF13|nr:hypothetical protein [Deinococcus apachensis]